MKSNKTSITEPVEGGKDSSTKATPTKKKNVNRKVLLDEEGNFFKNNYITLLGVTYQ